MTGVRVYRRCMQYAVCSMLHVVCSMLHAVYFVCCMLHVLYAVCCMLYVVCCMQHVACCMFCMLHAVCCMLYVACSMLHAVCCMQYAACCMFCMQYVACCMFCMLHILYVVCSMLYAVCFVWAEFRGSTLRAALRIGRPLLAQLQAEPKPSPGADVAAARRAAVTSDWPLAFAICDVARRCRSIGPVRAQSFALLVCAMPCCPGLGPATTLHMPGGERACAWASVLTGAAMDRVSVLAVQARACMRTCMCAHGVAAGCVPALVGRCERRGGKRRGAVEEAHAM